MKKILNGLILAAIVAVIGLYFYYFHKVRQTELAHITYGTGIPATMTGLEAHTRAKELLEKQGLSSEQAWIAKSIGNDLARMIHFAKSRTLVTPKLNATINADSSLISFTLITPNGSKSIPCRLDPMIWSPEVYASLIDELASTAGLKLEAEGGPTPATPLQTLLDFRAVTIERENQRVSTWLTQAALNPAAHEEAALLCGVFALREASSCFYDARPALNRLTSHLALAQRLRGTTPPSDAGKAAAAILDIMTGRQLKALSKLELWQQSNPDDASVTAWVRALKLRNSGDWREIKTPETEPLLVRIEYMRALAQQIGNFRAIEYLKNDPELEKLPEFSRLAFDLSPSVEEGHRLTSTALPLELGEIKSLLTVLPGNYSLAKLADFVNTPPAGPVIAASDTTAAQIVVIDTGSWGRFYQRHLLHETLGIHNHIAYMWGVPEADQEFRNSVSTMLSQFTFYPLLDVRWNSPSHHKEANAAAIAFAQEHIELLSDNSLIQLQCKDQALSIMSREWITTIEPKGTTYAAEQRNTYEHSHADPVLLMELTPWSSDLADRVLSSDPKLSAAKVYGPLADYNLAAMLAVAKEALNNPDDYISRMRKICDIDPDYYLNLGQWAVQHQQPKLAAEAYQNAVDKANDSVRTSNSVEWLVNYYYDNGEKIKALKVAEFAAEVYSCSGLTTMMHLQEKMGNLAEAESYGYKILERYKNNTPLVEFFSRHTDAPGYAAFKKKLEDAVSTIFPGGQLPRVTLSSFKSAPDDGIRLGPSPLLQSFGIVEDTVIVAVDGIQVRNEDQYVYARGLSSSPKMDLIVWKRDHYEALTVEQKGRRFYVDIFNYKR